MKIQEIAKLTGVSPSTVSRVFSHHPNIREDVRERVFAVAKQYSYHPRLSTKQRNVVIITPYESIYPVQCCVEMLLMALTHELPGHGFRLEILPQDNLERLDSIQFCAAVAIGAEPCEFKEWEKRFSVPLVIVDRDAARDYPGVWLVRSNEEQAMELKSLQDHGLPADDSLIHYSADEQYVEIIGKLLRRGIDALFCPGGSGGIIAAYALSLFNRRVPEDISLIASEQTFFSRYGVPPQTTISPDYKALAASTADLIEARIGNLDFPRRTILPYILNSRESVR